MKEIPSETRPLERPRRSLEQKIMLMVHRYRTAEKRRARSDAARSKRLRMIALLALTVIVLPSVAILLSHSSAHGAEAAFERADGALASGHYVQATHDYEQIMARKGYSGPLLFNLGNSFYREGKWGPAILNYERALWLSPRDSAAAANLELARQHAGLTAPALNPFERAARVLNANTLAWVGSAALAFVALGLVAGRLLGPTWRGPARATVLAATILLAVAGSGLGYWWTRLDRAVILANDSPAHMAPASAATVSFDLREGQLVRERKTYGDFALIRTDDGRSGWVSQQNVAPIVPPRFASVPAKRPG